MKVKEKLLMLHFYPRSVI